MWEALLSRIPPFLKRGERGPPPSLPRSLELSSLFALFCFGSSSLHPTAPPPPPPAVPKETDKGLESLADTISQLFPSPPRSNLGKACTHQCQKKVNGYRINHSKPLTGHKLPSAHITIRPNHYFVASFDEDAPLATLEATALFQRPRPSPLLRWRALLASECRCGVAIAIYINVHKDERNVPLQDSGCRLACSKAFL